MSVLARDLTTTPAIERPRHAEDSSQQSNVRRLRLLTRRKVAIPAFLRHGERALAIEIRNISVGGVGFALPSPIGVGETVSLHLLDGRVIAGTLQWSRLGFAGIAFETALLTDDPLLGNSGTAQTPVPSANVPQVVGTIMSFAAAVSASFENRKRTRDHKMIEAACRKQGFAWLTEDDAEAKSQTE